MGKSSKKSASKVEVAPAVVATKPLKKGKREAEEAAEQVPAKKQKQHEAALKQAIAKKKAETKVTKKSKKAESSSEDDSSSASEEEVKVKPAVKRPVKKVESSSEEDSSSDEETVVPAKVAKLAPKAKAASSSSEEDSSSEDDEPKSKVLVKTVSAAKNGSVAAKKKDESNDESDSESEESEDALISSPKFNSMETPAQSKSALLFKNRLQEYAQKAGIPLPIYRTTNEGTPHAPMFRSTVEINGAAYTSPNVFLHRKSAEMDAARIALPSLPLQIDAENCSLELEDIFICKSILNEYAVKINAEKPIYETKTSDGLPPAFSSVTLNGKQYVGNEGRNKKESQQLAARAAILSLLDSDARTVISKIITNSKKRLTAAKEKDKHPHNTQNEVEPVRIPTESNFGTSASKGNELKVVVLNGNMPRASILDHCTGNSARVSAKPISLDESRSSELEPSLVGALEANCSPLIPLPPSSEQLIDSTSAKKRKRGSKKANNKVGIDAQ